MEIHNGSIHTNRRIKDDRIYLPLDDDDAMPLSASMILMYNGFLEVVPAAFDEVNSAETSRPGSSGSALLSFDEYKLI
jgi:hypothetical protein